MAHRYHQRDTTTTAQSFTNKSLASTACRALGDWSPRARARGTDVIYVARTVDSRAARLITHNF